MAGSPEYLALLDQLQAGMETFQHETADWVTLDVAWNQLEAEPANEANLATLAHIALQIWTQEKGVSFADTILTSKETHINKNAGYAGADNPDPWANFRMAERFGISAFMGTLVRMSDKYIRIINLRKDPNNERVGESILDTLIDLAAYALIAICLLREEMRPSKSLMN